MDNLDDSENPAKVSDSAYSTSCSNSQSRRSHSSKSTHSGSNSSGSSGYGGKPSTSGSSTNLPKKEKEAKKKKSPQVETVVTDVVVETELGPPEPAPVFDVPKEETGEVAPAPPPTYPQSEKGVESMEICTSDRNSSKDEAIAVYNFPVATASTSYAVACPSSPCFTPQDGFSCVISMHDGVVMYTTSSLTTTLGFPKDMWIGRSFIDFVHPRDRGTFASQITSGLAIPKIVNGTQLKVQSPDSVTNMVCRIRRYRGLTIGFGIKDRNVNYLPFLLKLSFKNISDDEGKIIYLVIQATPFYSAFRCPNEVMKKATPFVLRHAASGNIEYVDLESVQYLGYLPQDLVNTNALLLYHPDDLSYLRHVYEVIVKNGSLPRSKAFRMLANNGDYVKLETEWSSFINPWSKKLEFVIGKHHVVEGSTNPDVFIQPETEKPPKISEEERSKTILLRETIIRIMNDVPTKPAEVAKQQMSKRCQDLAVFMESLMEEPNKLDDDLRLEIQDPDNSYYERDSVMLGGISPHHEYHDSKSSTETPLSYNQLNYNDTLQRYFDSHQPYSSEECDAAAAELTLGFKDTAARMVMTKCLSPLAQFSGDSGDLTSSSESNIVAALSASMVRTGEMSSNSRLTEGLLNRHNNEMERELMKLHRETRSSSKSEREKVSNENRLKKKEHLARCNASYQPTTAGAGHSDSQPHGVKRSSKYVDSDNKHHCSSTRQSSRRTRHRSSSNNGVIPPPPFTTSVSATTQCWPNSSMNNMNTFFAGIPQPMPFVGSVSPMPGMFPMFYTHSTSPAATSTNTATTVTMCHPPALHMVYGQPMYGSPLMYSPMSHALPFHQTMMAHSMMYSNANNPLGLTNGNYEQCKRHHRRPNVAETSVHACKPRNLSDYWRDKKSSTHFHSSTYGNPSGLSRESAAHSIHSGIEKSAICSSDIKSSSDSLSPKSREAIPEKSPTHMRHYHKETSDEVTDKTDGESSNSSFYSSFFKTESGSVEESSDAKKVGSNEAFRMRNSVFVTSRNKFRQTRKVPKRKMEPHWLEKVCVTSELIYKYQILTKNVEEVLSADKLKLNTLEQPSLVNEQLSQLYLEMQLDGVAARLALEEGITSSSSSGEETTPGKPKTRRKHEYSKLMMIYEEDAPLPPPSEEESEPQPSGSGIKA